MKQMTESEKMVGRLRPNEAKPIDRFLADFLAATGEPLMRMKPTGDEELACHRKARRLGWIRSGAPVYSPSGSQKALYWELTGPGELEAKAALGRVSAALAEQQAWTRAFLAKHREAHPRPDDTGPKPSEKNFAAPTM